MPFLSPNQQLKRREREREREREIIYFDDGVLLVTAFCHESLAYATHIQITEISNIITAKHRPMLGRSLFLLRNRSLALVVPDLNRSG